MRRSAQRKRISGRKGFTLAELLVVVAIILILAGFGFVAVNRYQKRLKRVEMDNVAREIFVAAQNHLTASRAAGFWDGYVAQMEKDSSNRDFSSKLGKPVGNGSTDKQYVADEENRNAEASSGASAKSSDNVLKILLPYAAVDETLLTDGKYYVHYDAATASVLDVYYTDKDAIPEYGVLNESAKNDVSYRTEHGVGWYGTAAITDTEPQSELKAPVMAVRNAESLVVYIIDPNYNEFKSGVRLEIAQTGQDGKKTGTVEKNLTLNSTGSGLYKGDDPLSGFVQVQHVTETDNKPITLADGSTAKDYMLYAVVLDSITRKGGHFSQLFPELTAGADITVTATVSSDQASGEAKSSVTTNSLFEALNNGNALISNARHLENLSVDISALKAKARVTTAEITDDLYWNGIRRTKKEGSSKEGSSYAPYTGSAEAFIDAIRRADWKYGYQSLDTKDQGSDGSPAIVQVYSSDGKQMTYARKFAGIETATLQKLSGNDHVLTGFDIVADFAGTGDKANAAPSGAGLFASTGKNGIEIDHLTVKNTRVYAAYTFGSSAALLSAGTLVGNANGSVTLRNVSAVTDCIKDGEIYQAGTYNLTNGKSGLEADSSQASTVPLVDNQISGVYSRDGIAGGLIGTAGGKLEIENSFASVPVYSAASNREIGSNSGATGNAGIAGGLVGKAAEGTITASFAGGYTDATSTASTSNDYSSTTINVAAPEGIAGGLIGAVTGNLNTTETYATTSVSASVGGGFVGVVSRGNLDLGKCYSTGRVFAKTEVKNNSGKFAGSIANNGSITSSESLQKADASEKIAEVKNGVLAGTASSNGETSEGWTFPENLIGGETDIKKSNPNTLQEIPAEDLAAVAGNHDFKAENQTKETGVLTYAYKSSLKGKDYPYPSYTKTSDNSSIQNYAGYDTTGTTKNYNVSSYLHYGDWVVLSEEKSSDVVLGNDAVLYADLKVPEDVAKKDSDGAMTLIVVGESSKNAVCFVIRKENADKDPVHGTKLKLKRLSFFRQNWYGTSNYEDTTDTTAIIKKADDQSTDISVPSTGDSSGSSGSSSDDVTYRIYLDDITTAKGHFGIVCPVLVPGENIKVFAAKGEKKLSEDELKKYIDEEDVPKEARANSLFGNETEYDVAKETGAAQILNGRHLQNLDMETSHAFQKYNNKGENTDIQINFNSAYLDTDIDWGIFKDQVAQCKETADENGKGNNISVYSYDGIAGDQNKFQGILNFDWSKQDQGITDFSGKGKSDNEVHSLLNLDIERKDNSGSALFRDIRTKGMDLHDLNIENISSVSYSGHAAALFAYTQTLDEATVTVKNVKISGQVNIESKGASAGVILGDTQIPANIENTQIKGTVIVKAGENGNAGGFIGVVNGNGNTTISNSRIHFTTLKSGQGEQSMQSSVIGGLSAGGLIGSSYNQKITVSQISVTSEDEVRVSVASSKNDSLAGGIIGYAGNLSANYTYAGGKNFVVSGFQNAGGFVGEIGNGEIKNSAASAYVKASGNNANAGGFIGSSDSSVVVSDSYAGGHTKDGQYLDDETGEGRYNVQSSGNAGGFAGATNNGTISDCYSTASVFGASDTGGFRGTGSGKITNSYCTGLVKASGQIQAGAFVGNNWEYYTNEEINGNRYITRINASQNLIDVGNNVQNHVATGVAYSDLVQENKSGASPFDELLSKEEGYPFPAVNKINYVAHYGDWPLLQPPKSLDVAVMNDEILYADVAPEGSSTSLPENLTVVIKGQSSNHYQQFVIVFNQDRTEITSILRTGWANGQQSRDSQDIVSESPSSFAHITDGKLRLYLDDVTTEGGTFAKLCPALWPGEAIKVVAYEGVQTMDAESLSSYAVSFDKAVAHNSLFADSTRAAASRTVDNIQAHISMNRHLQNLDVSTSSINDANLKVTGAVLDNDLDWSKFARKVAEIKDTNVPKVNYTGIVNNDLTDFDGNSHTISSLTIDNSKQTVEDTDNGAGYSGLFREIKTDSEIKIHDLTLKNMVSTGIVAGGLVGVHSGGTLSIDNVSVLYDDNSAAITASGNNGNAGGLVGMSRSSLSITDSVVAGKNMTVASDDSASAGGLVGAHSAGTLTISNSAAAVYVQGGIAAGGVIGSADSALGSEITNTYAGGHTVNGFYVNSQNGEGRFNVRATAQTGNAGGLIGSAGNLTIKYSYATASVYSSYASGGFIGQAKSGTLIQDSYCTGLVKGTKFAGTFCGYNEIGSGSPVANPDNQNNIYLSGVNYRLMPVCGNDSTSQEEESSAKLAKAASYYELEEGARSGKTSPFDSTLGTAYPFSQRAIINGIVHYGDWPARQNVKDQYVVTFHYQNPGQSNAWVAVPKIAYYGKVEPVIVPHSEEQTFLGWYDAENGGSRIPDEAFENVTADMDVYAHTAKYISFYQYNPEESSYSTEAMQVAIERTSDGIETVELPAATSYLSDWAFDGWYTEQNGSGPKLGDARQSITLDVDTKTALVESNYKAYAHYTKLTKYTITLHFRKQMVGQTLEKVIGDRNAEGWYQDLVFEQSNGTNLQRSGDLPKSDVDSKTSGNVSSVYKAVDENGKKTVKKLDSKQDGVLTDGILSVDTKNNEYSITCDNDQEYSDQDYYLIYGDSKEASYTVKHVFEDSENGSKELFDQTTGKLAMNISDISYKKDDCFTYTETLQGSVGSYTTASALMTKEEAEKAGQTVDNNRVLPVGFSGFEPKGVILQKKIAKGGTTVIEIQYVRKTFTLNYDLNSGLITTDNEQQKSYKASEAYEFGQTVTLPGSSVLTRKGYHLGTDKKENSDKWAVVSKQDYDQRAHNGTEKYTAEDLFVNDKLTMPAYNCYVIANWEANTTADIKIEIFQQKVTDQMNLADDKKEYDFYTSTTVTDVDTTKTLNVPAIMKLLGHAESDSSNPLPDSTHADSDTGYLSYDHFGFNSNKYNSENGESPKANPDGTTVIKLYYDRDIMHFVFNYGGFSEYVKDKQNTFIPVDVDPVTVWKVTVTQTKLEQPVSMFVEDEGIQDWYGGTTYKKDSEYWVYLNGEYSRLSNYTVYYYNNGENYQNYFYDPIGCYIFVNGKKVKLDQSNCLIGTYKKYYYAYSYSWSSETYTPKYNEDKWQRLEKKIFFGHFIQNNVEGVKYISAKNYAEYLNQTDASENPISQYEDVTNEFDQLKRVEFSDVPSNADWYPVDDDKDYLLGYNTGPNAEEVWKGLYDANFTNYKNSDGTLLYEWLHDSSKDQKVIYRPGNFSWYPGESKNKTDILTKFSLAASFGDNVYDDRDRDRNYVRFTAGGEIATSGEYIVYHYLEKENSGRPVNKTSGLSSDYFENEAVNVIIYSGMYSGKSYSYLFDPLYTGYELYGANRKKSKMIDLATQNDSFDLDNENPRLYGYYIRLPYSIEYASVKDMARSTYLFKDSVEKLSVPESENRPETIDPDDVFDGWYDSSADNATQIADKDGNLTEDGKKLIAADNDHPGTMPSNNIQVFAHWKHANRNVTFDLNPGSREELDNVTVTYSDKRYKNLQSVVIEKGSSLTSLPKAPDKANIPSDEQFLYWYIISDSNGEKTEIPIDRTFVINENTTIYAKWAKDDMVTYTIRTMLYGEDGIGDENLGKDVTASVVRGTNVPVKAPTVEGCRLVGGSKEGDYKLDEDTIFKFYYQKLPGAWEYRVKQYIEYTDIDDSSKTIRILFNQFAVPTTKRSVVVNAMDLLGKDADGKMQPQLEYEYASIDGQKTNQQTIQVDQDNKVAEFVYRPSKELLGASLVDVHNQTVTYDGTAKTVEKPTINGEGKLLLKDVNGGSAILSGEDQATYRRVNGKENTDKTQLIHAGTYMETVPVKLTYNGKAITIARIRKTGLVIRPKDVIVASKTAEILYTKDGVYQKNVIEGVDVSNNGFFDSDSIQLNITYKWTNKPLQVGSVKNAFDCTLSGNNISDYNVTYKEGTLTVYWPLTINHVLLYGPDTDADGNPALQKQILLDTTEMSENTDKTVTVTPLNLTKPDPENNSTEKHWYGLEVSKKSSENNDSWQVSYNSENNYYSPKSADVKYSRYDAGTHTYTVYYELPMLKGLTAVDGNVNITFKDPTIEGNAEAYKTVNEQLYAGADILVQALYKAVSEQERQNQTIMTRTTYSYRLESSPDRKKLSLNLIETVTKYKDTNNNNVLDNEEITDDNRVSSTETTPNPVVTTTELRSVTIDTQQTSSGGQEAPATSTP